MCDVTGFADFLLGPSQSSRRALSQEELYALQARGGQMGLLGAQRIDWMAWANRGYAGLQHPQMLGLGAQQEMQQYQNMSRYWVKLATTLTRGDYFKEKPTMEVYTEKIDKHLLIKVGCKKRIAHDKKELRAIMIEFLDKNIDVLWEGGAEVPRMAADQERMPGPGGEKGCVTP